jgi:cytochrome c
MGIELMTPARLALLPLFALVACGNDPAPATASNSSDTAATLVAADDAVTGAIVQSVILDSLGEAYASADLANGARQFRRCQSCHTLDAGGRHTVGPNLHRIIGRPAASADRFSFSSQLEDAGLTWDLETLDAWIANPRALVPGNRMSFVGLRDPEDRRDLIAYIAVESAVE